MGLPLPSKDPWFKALGPKDPHDIRLLGDFDAKVQGFRV